MALQYDQRMAYGTRTSRLSTRPTASKSTRGAYWSFANGKLIKSKWTNSWGMYYWSDGDGKLVQGQGTWKGYKWDFGNDGTYYVKNATPKSLNKLVEQLNK
ncbi:hypothetical protein [Weissella cibaria]|uniref:hypothetical protein n=1 Tax=Weissella cibaria TaxID=137591 RepID=UPI00106F08E4|nr:hypothetical protein [Weissella cibaria]